MTAKGTPANLPGTGGPAQHAPVDLMPQILAHKSVEQKTLDVLNTISEQLGRIEKHMSEKELAGSAVLDKKGRTK